MLIRVLSRINKLCHFSTNFKPLPIPKGHQKMVLKISQKIRPHDPPPFIKAEVLKQHSFWDLPLSQIFPEHISCGWPLAITLTSYVDHHIWYMIKRALSPLFSVCNHYNHIFPEHISFEQPPVIILKSYEDHHIIIWWSSYHHKGHKCLHSQSLFHFIGNFVWANFNYS